MWETFPIEQIHSDKRSFTMKEKQFPKFYCFKTYIKKKNIFIVSKFLNYSIIKIAFIDDTSTITIETSTILKESLGDFFTVTTCVLDVIDHRIEIKLLILVSWDN